METITADEKYWLDYLFKPKEGEERLPELDDDQLAELGEFYLEDE